MNYFATGDSSLLHPYHDRPVHPRMKRLRIAKKIKENLGNNQKIKNGRKPLQQKIKVNGVKPTNGYRNNPPMTDATYEILKHNESLKCHLNQLHKNAVNTNNYLEEHLLRLGLAYSFYETRNVESRLYI